jgi:hypothetical protein
MKAGTSQKLIGRSIKMIVKELNIILQQPQELLRIHNTL